MNKKLFLSLSILVMFIACQNDSKIEKDISTIEVDFEVERFDKIFSKSNPNDLPKLKTTFPFLFSKRIPDSIWINKMNDTLQHQLYSEIDKKMDLSLTFKL